jgi:type IV secretion system protein TrbG
MSAPARALEQRDAQLDLALSQAPKWRLNSAVLSILCGASLIGAACSRAAPPIRAPEPGFLRASPIVEYGPPSVEPKAPDDATPTEGDATRSQAIESGDSSDPAASPEDEPRALLAVAAHSTSAPAPALTPASTPSAVIAQANAMASQAPESDGFLNAVMTYTFMPGGIYKVFTAPDNATDLALEPGEDIVGQPVAGDVLRWRLGVGTSAVNGIPQKHVFIKPTRAGLATNLFLNTDRRTYFIKLESVEQDSMMAVQWTYPQAQAFTPAAAAATLEPAATASTADVTALNFDYAIEVTEGRPAWKPQAVYDNGVKTFIRFDPSMLHGESPALFVLERDEMQLVNYRVKKNLYIVDRLFKLAELRLGQDDQDVVRLRNRRAPRPKEPQPQPRTGRTPSPSRPGTPW